MSHQLLFTITTILGAVFGSAMIYFGVGQPKSEITILVPTEATGPLSAEILDSFGHLDSCSPQIILDERHETSWRVFFASNREVVENSMERLEFGDRARRLNLGVSVITVPKNRPRGDATMSILPPATDPPVALNRLAIRSHRLMEEHDAMDAISRMVEKSRSKTLLVMIHGYNVTHEAAMTRACQVANDMPFDGAILSYTWPSQGTLEGYFRDEDNARYSASEFAELMGLLQRNLPSKAKIHILAHSMGNRVTLNGLVQATSFWKQEDAAQFGQLILAAPDVGIEKFTSQIDTIAPFVERISLYTSEKDGALALSYAIHGEVRAGQFTGEHISENLEVFDVSDIDDSALGHSYYGSSEAVLNDLYWLLMLDRDPRQSPWLEGRTTDGENHFWRFTTSPPAIMQAG